jgi:hypothetical protein
MLLLLLLFDVIPLKEMIKLAQLRLFGHVVRMGLRDTPNMVWQAITQGKRPRGRLQQACEEGVQKILKERGVEWNGRRAIARDHERWKVVCRPSTSTGRRDSTE